MNVHRQTNSSDCGVFAIAFAKTLLVGQDPCLQNYIYPRKHLAQHLPNESIPSFPSAVTVRLPKVLVMS